MNQGTKVILIFLLFIAFCVLIKYNLKESNKEGFEFTRCMNSGFTKDFCIKTPQTIGGPSVCVTDKGDIGQNLSGYGGGCNSPAYISPYIDLYW